MRTERVITVEYLQPSMSYELLGKFPDPSAYDFDYTQSSIWSPLLPRGNRSSSSLKSISSSKKLRSIKRKGIYKKSNNKNKKGLFSSKKLDFSPNPTPKRGWRRVLKAAMKKFKFHGRSPLHMVLPKS